MGISRAENCCVSIRVPHNIYLKECNHTKQSEHLTENTKFNFMAEKIFCYMYHSLFYSHKSELSPTLHLIFKQHFRENSRGELQLCNHKWAPWWAGGIEKILVGEDGTRFFFYSTLKSVSCSSQNLTFKILVWPHKQMHVKLQEKRWLFSVVRPYWHNSCQIKHIENTFCAQTVQMHNGNMANSSFHELNAAMCQRVLLTAGCWYVMRTA